MIQLVPQLKIMLAIEPVDFRKGADTLAALCRAHLQQDPLSGALFVFRNRAGTSLKLLVHDGVGFWLPSKRQNTTKDVQPGGLVTITDPSHPLYGQSFTVLRAYSPRAKIGLVIALPDGRARRIARAATDLVETPHHRPTIENISAPALLPLARLICAMVATPEVAAHDTEQHKDQPNRTQTPSAHPTTSPVSATDPSLITQPTSSTATHTMRRRSNRAPQKSSPSAGKERAR